ncbi:hypothetical protein ACM66B_002035 [Microbotryomycetes sp. NB124-2]
MADPHALRHPYQHMSPYEQHQQHHAGSSGMHVHSLHPPPQQQPSPQQHSPSAGYASYSISPSSSGSAAQNSVAMSNASLQPQPPAGLNGGPSVDAAYAYHHYQQQHRAQPAYGPSTYFMPPQHQLQHSVPPPPPQPQPIAQPPPVSPPFIQSGPAAHDTPTSVADMDKASPPRDSKPLASASTSAASPAASGTEGRVASKTKTRSSIACTNCRRQKMKCEGAREGLPCKRCAAARVRCTYELGQGSRNRAVRAGVASGDHGESGVCTPQRELPPAPLGLNDSDSYDRRLAALEVEMSVIRSLVSNVSPERHEHTTPGASPDTQMYDDQLVPQFGFPPPPNRRESIATARSYADQASHTHAAYQHVPVSSPSISLLLNPVPMPDMVRLAGMPKPRQSQRSAAMSDVMKRPKTEEADAMRDMIGRGLIAEDEAILCFDAYLATLNTPRDNRIPEVPLSFEDIRTRSSFLLSVLISIGARAIAHTDSHRTAVVESVRLTQESLLLPTPSILVIKALVFFSLYNGTSRYCGMVATTIDKLGLPPALFKLRDLADSERRSDKARELALHGRIFLTTWVWSCLYTVCAWAAPVQPYPLDAITEQIDILRTSDHTETTLDALLQTHIESAMFACRAWNELGPGMVAKKQTLSDKVKVVDKLVKDMSDWMERRQDMQELFNGWGDHSTIRKSTPYHHNRLIFDGYVLQKLEEADKNEITDDVRAYIRAAVETLFYCIKFGTETRMWLHHATAAHYWAQVKVPAALRFLFTCLRVVPDEICSRRVLDMLEGMERYLDRVNTPTITPLEIATAATLRVLIGEMREFVVGLSSSRRDGSESEDKKQAQESKDEAVETDVGMQDATAAAAAAETATAQTPNSADNDATDTTNAGESTSSTQGAKPGPHRLAFEPMVTAEDVTRAIDPDRGGDLAGSLESLRFDTAIWGIMLLE